MESDPITLDPSDLAKRLYEFTASMQPVLLWAGVVVGVLLLLVGSKLARPCCALSGLLIGGLCAAAAIDFIEAKRFMIFAVVATAAITCVVSWLAFRLWMGLTAALILALLAPLATMAWQGTTPQLQAESETQTETTLTADTDPTDAEPLEAKSILPDLGLILPGTEPDQSGEEESQKYTDLLLKQFDQQVYKPTAELVEQIWQGLSPPTRMTAWVAAAAGAVIGLLLGLILPYGAAGLQSALVGTLLMVFCGLQLLPKDMASRLTFSPRTTIVVLSLITVHGVGIQWTLFRRKVDK